MAHCEILLIRIFCFRIYGEGSLIGRLVYGPSMSVTIVKDEPSRNCGDEERGTRRSSDAIHCDTCDKTFRNNLSFGLHSIKHNKKYVCHICEYKTIVRNKFERHVKVHEGKNGYKCESCDKHFAVYIHAVEHKFFHTGEKPFQCHVCGKSFTYSRFLTAHCRSQHCEKQGKRLYSCTICNKHYVSCTGLTRHKQRYHTIGFDQSKLCDICGKRLASRDQLKFHRRIHTGDKPFSCEVCSKSFTRKDLLREHERVHTGERPYTCQHCNKCFTQRSPLKIHERTHTGERPFVCLMCKKGFIARGILNAHMKKCQGKL
uniref:C2H2-type domain-containing protein n=1 Tax=Photinus pyralis TaxID=7054 RepID=A0A1Y1KXA4_PHOPY